MPYLAVIVGDIGAAAAAAGGHAAAAVAGCGAAAVAHAGIAGVAARLRRGGRRAGGVACLLAVVGLAMLAALGRAGVAGAGIVAAGIGAGVASGAARLRQIGPAAGNQCGGGEQSDGVKKVAFHDLSFRE